MGSEERTCNAIILDPDPATRMLLKQATGILTVYECVQHASSVTGAMRLLHGDQSFEIVFISERLPDDVLRDFMRDARATPHGQTASYVLVMSGTKQEYQSVATRALDGIDAFLFAPYSVQHLGEITQVATELHDQRHSAHLRVALTLLLADLMAQLDLVAYLRAAKTDDKKETKRLLKMAESLRQFSSGPALERYYEILVDLYSECPTPRPRHEYRGASQRVRQKMEQKLIEEVRKTGSQYRIIKK